MSTRDPMPSALDASEFSLRRERVAAEVKRRQLGAVIAWSDGATFYGDVKWLANHYATSARMPDTDVWQGASFSALVVTAAGEATLLTTSHAHPDDAIPIEDVRRTWQLPRDVAALLLEKGLAGERIGVAGHDTLVRAHYEMLVEQLDGACELVAAPDLVENLRYVKSAAELEWMRHAAKVGTRWMSTMMEACVPGATEGEVVGAGLHLLAAEGGYPTDIAISSGPDSFFYRSSAALPHWNIVRPMQPGDIVRIDAWGPVQGFYTDLMRSTIVGRSPSDVQRELLEASVGVVEAIVEEIRPGVTLGALYDRGVQWLDDNGRSPKRSADGKPDFPCFGHLLGVTIERPHIVHGDQTVLKQGMVVAVEAGLTDPALGMSGFEDNAIVTAGGAEVITAGCPAAWW